MNDSTEKEKEQLKSQIKGLQAQLTAHQQMCNEFLASSVQVRTQMIMFQSNLQEANQKIAELEKGNKLLNEENAALLSRVTELDARLSQAA